MNTRKDPALTQLSKPLDLREQLELVGVLLVLMWAVEIVDLFLMDGALDKYGIRPREIDGLWGIALAPFLHGGTAHLAANSLPFVILSWLTLNRGFKAFVFVSMMITALGGLGVWVFGQSNSVHLGASILIFGYLGFLLFVGLKTGTFRDLAISLLVAGLYGSLIWGVLPGTPGISWEGHLFGFLGGIAAARKIK